MMREFKMHFIKFYDGNGSYFRLQKLTSPAGRWAPARGINLVQERTLSGRLLTYLIERIPAGDGGEKDGVKIPVHIRSSISTKGVELVFTPYKGIYALVRANKLPAKGVYLAPDEGAVISDGVVNMMYPIVNDPG